MINWLVSVRFSVKTKFCSIAMISILMRYEIGFFNVYIVFPKEMILFLQKSVFSYCFFHHYIKLLYFLIVYFLIFDLIKRRKDQSRLPSLMNFCFRMTGLNMIVAQKSCHILQYGKLELCCVLHSCECGIPKK